MLMDVFMITIVYFHLRGINRRISVLEFSLGPFPMNYRDEYNIFLFCAFLFSTVNQQFLPVKQD